jgi:hypothetical protein
LATALIGSIVVAALTSATLTGPKNNPEVSEPVAQQVGAAVSSGSRSLPSTGCGRPRPRTVATVSRRCAVRGSAESVSSPRSSVEPYARPRRGP